MVSDIQNKRKMQVSVLVQYDLYV